MSLTIPKMMDKSAKCMNMCVLLGNCLDVLEERARAGTENLQIVFASRIRRGQLKLGLELWSFGGLELWSFGDLEAWRLRALEAWRLRALEAWRLEAWSFGGLEAWNFGGLEFGGLEAWSFLLFLNVF